MYCSTLSGSVMLITNGSSFTSMPRAATSVQMRMRVAPFLNDYFSLTPLSHFQRKVPRRRVAHAREDAAGIPSAHRQGMLRAR